MNTHWSTVCSNRESLSAFPVFLYNMVWLRIDRVLQFSILCQFHIKLHVSKSGVGIPVEAIFCDVTPMTTQSINQSIELFEKKFSTDWPLQKVGRRKKAKKSIDWDSNPRPGNVEFERGKAPYDSLLLHIVFQWVFIRQLALSASR